MASFLFGTCSWACFSLLDNSGPKPFVPSTSLVRTTPGDIAFVRLVTCELLHGDKFQPSLSNTNSQVVNGNVCQVWWREGHRSPIRTSRCRHQGRATGPRHRLCLDRRPLPGTQFTHRATRPSTHPRKKVGARSVGWSLLYDVYFS